jgi:hypothetical protein
LVRSSRKVINTPLLQVLEEFSGENVAPAWFAPAWFAPALAPALATALQPLRNDIRIMRNDIKIISTKLSNRLMSVDEDTVIPPPHGNAPDPVGFPSTMLGLRTLETGPYLIEIENYYGLQHTGSLPTRKRKVFHAYGLQY